jgi:hypothetical protein
MVARSFIDTLLESGELANLPRAFRARRLFTATSGRLLNWPRGDRVRTGGHFSWYVSELPFVDSHAQFFDQSIRLELLYPGSWSCFSTPAIRSVKDSTYKVVTATR